MLELVASDDINDTTVEKRSLSGIETALTPLSDICCDNDLLNAENIANEVLIYRELNPSDFYSGTYVPTE